MAAVNKKYCIGKNRLSRGLLNGFQVTEDGGLQSVSSFGRHTLFLEHLDGGETDCQWGRFVFDAALEDEVGIVVRTFASNDLQFVGNGSLTAFDTFLKNDKESVSYKEKLFFAMSASKVTDCSDMLLYEQKGRYLWIFIEVVGNGNAILNNFRVFNPGDNFLNTFPEVYRTNGAFFHRYLSIFSSLYNDFQTTIDTLDRFVDVDTAPDGLLPVFAGWLGIELDGNFLEPEQLRKLLKAAYPMIRAKGTRKAVLDIVRLFVDEPVYIVEQSIAGKYGDFALTERGESIYGSSPYDFLVMINRQADEKLHSRLLFLLNQFKPVRSRVGIVFLRDGGKLDSHSYLDVNAELIQASAGSLDRSSALNGLTFLQ